MKKKYLSYCKFFLLLVMIIAVCLLKDSTSFVRPLLYVTAGGVLAAKVRRDKVAFIEYFALVVLIYLDVALLFPVLLPARKAFQTILEIGGLYSIILFITGALIGYIVMPSSRMN